MLLVERINVLLMSIRNVNNSIDCLLRMFNFVGSKKIQNIYYVNFMKHFISEQCQSCFNIPIHLV